MEDDPTHKPSVPEPSDVEKIRLKRLAKLEQVNPPSDPISNHSKTPKASTASAPAAALSSALGGRQAISAKPQAQGDSLEKKAQFTKTQKSVRSFEDWQNEAISKILQVSLDKSAVEQSGNQLIYLKSLVDELMEQESENPPESFKLSSALLDRALVSRLSIDPNAMYDDEDSMIAALSLPNVSVFDYLLDCWKRAAEIRRNMSSRAKTLDPSVINQRIGVLDAVKTLVVSYAGLVLQMPDMFPQVNTSQQLTPRLLAETDTPEGLPLEFIKELATRFETDGFEEVFGPALTALSENMRGQNILSEFHAPLRAILTLSDIKSAAAMLPTLHKWNPPTNFPREFETESLLGPFCRLSTFPTDERGVADTYFANASSRPQSDIEYAVTSLRSTIQTHQRTLHTLFKNILVSSPEAREGVLSYFAKAIKLNEKRARMHVNPDQVGTDGFLTNLLTVLLKLADPFMDTTYSKVGKIDTDYFRKSRRIDISQMTKIRADQQESDVYYGNIVQNQESPNFISEIFFLTVATFHYGLMHTLITYNAFMRDLSELQKQYDQLKEDQPNWAGTTSSLLNEQLLKRLKAQLDTMFSQKIAFDVQLMDNALLSHSLQFYNLVMTWLLRVVDPNKEHPSKLIKLPLQANPPPEFAMLPEYFIEDITEFFLFISRYNPMIIISNSRDELVVFIIAFLRSSSYIKNPYLKAKLVEILFYFTLPFRGQPEGGLGALLNTHPLSLEHLVPALMQFYCEVEQTGAHTQFYDKFHIRYNISQIFRAIWKNDVHAKRLIKESKNSETFVRFANLLMNDATFLLDESLSKLTEIHTIQDEIDNTSEWQSKTGQYRREREALLQSLERQATSYMSLGSETVHMLDYMTGIVISPFVAPQIVERLAAMLDYNLVLLVGPKCQDLKVKNKEKYRFDPKSLLAQILNIYLHLCDHQEFVQAVAHDGRSYSKELFARASYFVKKHNVKPESDMKKLDEFVSRVEETIKLEAEDEDELGDIPDEFIDPVMYTLMVDPVILPSSKISVDRSTITTHLLSDPKDPFNREPLSIEDVIPNTELKKRIAEFKQSKKQQRKT